MSTNLKSGNAIVRLLLRHGEKIGIVLLLGCAGMLIYSSLGRERLTAEQQPDRLETSANQADSSVRDLKPSDIPEEEEIRAENAPIRVGDAAIQKVSTGNFPNFQPFDPAVLRPLKRRQDPILLPAEDLEVNASSGLWASDDPEAIRRRVLEEFKKSEEERREEERRRREQAEEGGRGMPGGEMGYAGGRMGAMGGMGGMISDMTDSGALIIRPRGGAQTQGFETIKSRSWVTVLAKVPIEAQVNQYNDALEESLGYVPDRDMPTYRGYIVERAEITPEGQQDWDEIARVSDRYIIRRIETWPTQTPEVIDSKYQHPLLTFPLPPMVLREWGEDVTHSDLPLPSLEDMFEQFNEEGAAGEETEEEEINPDAPWARRERSADPRRGGRMEDMMMGRGGRGRSPRGGMGRMPGGYGGRMEGGMGMEMEMGMGMGMGMMGGEMEMMGMGMGMGRSYGRMGSNADVELPPYQWDYETSHLLFRFFDTTVEAGRQYRYRVRLVLTDVNYDIEEKYNDPEVNVRRKEAKNDVRLTEWSEPSPIASVPLTGLIYIASAEQANENNFNDQPEAELLIKSLVEEYAAEVALAEKFERGSVVNVTEYAKVIVARNFQLEEGDKEPEFNFYTGITLLDFDGGERIKKSKEITAPARALMMDSAGRLMRQSEFDDLETVEEYRQIVEQAKEASARERGRESGGELGYPGFGGSEF